MSTFDLVKVLAREQGWNDATIIQLLCDYLDLIHLRYPDCPKTVEDFLQQVLDNERAAAGMCTACLHSEHYDASCTHTNCNCEA